MEIFKVPLNLLKNSINQRFVRNQPWEIVAITSSSVLFLTWFYQFAFCDDEYLTDKLKRYVFTAIRKLPAIKKEIEIKRKEVADSFNHGQHERTKDLSYIRELPERGLEHDKIISLVESNLNLGTYSWEEGQVSGSVYYFDPEWQKLLGKVYEKTFITNPLHPDLFPGICKMESEIVQMVANLFHGDQEVCGSVTSGGTESILLACKTWRDYMRTTKGIKKPEMVLPKTAHSAFDKAAQYFSIRTKYVPVNPETLNVDLKAMQRAITKNTIMLVGSVPNFPYGTMDDIESISKLGLIYQIPVHVDSCLGGFLTAFMDKAGYRLPPYDFKLPGVTSISVDTHKYGFTPKGSSVILYRDKNYRHYQYTVTTDWPGGIYGSPTISGSRAGANITTCWASLMYFGLDGYIQATNEIVNTAKFIESKLREIDGIFVFGVPVTSVVAFGSNDFDIFKLGSEMKKFGWNLNTLQFPSGVHIAVTHLHTKEGVAERFIEHVKEVAAKLLESPDESTAGELAIYGASQMIPDRSLVGEFINYYIDALYYIPPKMNDALYRVTPKKDGDAADQNDI